MGRHNLEKISFLDNLSEDSSSLNSFFTRIWWFSGSFDSQTTSANELWWNVLFKRANLQISEGSKQDRIKAIQLSGKSPRLGFEGWVTIFFSFAKPEKPTPIYKTKSGKIIQVRKSKKLYREEAYIMGWKWRRSGERIYGHEHEHEFVWNRICLPLWEGNVISITCWSLCGVHTVEDMLRLSTMFGQSSK